MKKIIALAITAALSTAAQADGFYVGGDVGKSRISDIEFKGTSYALYGGYNFSDSIAAEVGYRNLGKETYTLSGRSATVKLSAFQVSAVFSAAVSKEFSVFGRLGVNTVDIKATGPAGVGKADETRALVGFGARYALSKEFGLRAEFQKPASDVKVFSFGADYRF
jgi:hypothetical protein